MNNFYYEYQKDAKYCYANSYILINKLNIRNQTELDKAERELTSLEIAEAEITYIKGNFDIQHLKNIHHKIFSNIYSWAGDFRTVDISKGTLFCKPEFIEDELTRVFLELKNEKYLVFTKAEDISERFSYYLGEINAIHPFREGNGRTQRLFIEYLGYISGYEINFSNTNKTKMLNASLETFNKKYDTMKSIFKEALKPIPTNLSIKITKEIFTDSKLMHI